MGNIYVTEIEVRAFRIDLVYKTMSGSTYLISSGKIANMSVPIGETLLDKHMPVVGKWHVQYSDGKKEIFTEEEFNQRFRKKFKVKRNVGVESESMVDEPPRPFINLTHNRHGDKL